MKKVSLKAKIDHFEKTKIMNYRASMRLEGIDLTKSDIPKQPDHALTKRQILEKYESRR